TGPSTVDKAEAKTKHGAKETKDATVKGAEKTKDATVKGAKKTGEKTKDVAGTTGEVITDSWITTKIKADFINEDALKDSEKNVAVIIACCCVSEIVEMNSPSASVHSTYSRLIPRRSQKLPRSGTSNQNTATATTSTTSIIAMAP